MWQYLPFHNRKKYVIQAKSMVVWIWRRAGPGVGTVKDLDWQGFYMVQGRVGVFVGGAESREPGIHGACSHEAEI